MICPADRLPGRRDRAFTLMELLVVLAIVAVLAAVLFPVLAQARQHRGDSCMSNHLRLVEAAALYSEDNNQIRTLKSPGQLSGYLGTQALSLCPNGFTVGSPKYIHERGLHEASGRGGQANMVWHNGTVMNDAITEIIFWGKSWNGYSGDKMTGLDTWYRGFGGSNYAVTSEEYTGSSGTKFGGSTSHMGSILDISAAPTSAPSTSQILNEVCKVVTNPVPNGYYAVYVDTKRGSAGYCAWHSYGSCGGVPVQIAFFFNLDGDPGCDPQDATTGHSQGLAALANVSAHELSEAITDPRNGGWYDRSGAENGDKCAWTFNVPSVTLSNGSQWKLQGEWSNAAYTAGTGYPNNSGQHGCLDGH